MNSLSLRQDSVLRKLSLLQQGLIFLGTCSLSLLGLWLAIPIYYIVLFFGAIGGAIIISRSATLILFTYLASVILIGLRMDKQEHQVGALEVLVALVMCSAILYIGYRKIILKEQLSFNPLLYTLLAYTIWVLSTGLLSISYGNNNVNDWFREFLAFSPLFVVPLLYRLAAKEVEQLEKYFLLFLLLFGGIIFLISVYRVRSTMLQSTFLFQTGFARFDIMNGAFMTLLLFSLAGFKRFSKHPYVMAISILTAIVGFILTFNRTSWVAMCFCLPLLYIIAPKDEKTQMKKVIARGILLSIILSTILLILFPFASTLVQFFFGHFLTSSHVKSDASLLGRYVEWRYVLKQIFNTPLTGVGFGGHYWLYGWLSGYSYSTGYTHSGILLLLLKGGIVGFILMAITFGSFIVLGIRLSRSAFLQPLERSLVRVGLVSIAFLVFQMLTVGIFIHRELIWYLGLVWGYFLVKKEKVDLLRSAKEHTQAVTAGE